MNGVPGVHRSSPHKPQRHGELRLALRDIRQLFNAMDPSPLDERDLADNAVSFLVSWAREFAPRTPLTLYIELQEWPGDEVRGWVPQTIHHYFRYRRALTAQQLSRLLRRGRLSLLIGTLFVATCSLAATLLDRYVGGFTLSFAKESLTILGWAAMWQPLQIYLYDWWPLAGLGRVYERMSAMPIHIVRARGAVPASHALTPDKAIVST